MIQSIVFLNKQQGESAPGIRKGTCANHLSAIQKFFKGIHVTVNARTEDEVDEEAILDKVAKASGSTYNFNRIESREDEAPKGPVVNHTVRHGRKRVSLQ